MKAGMHHPLEKKGPAEKGANEQKTQPEEAGLSPVSHSGKYHSLIQDQARELTHLRQKMRIGKAVSSLLIQHVKNTVKTFEELLSSNNIDHYMEQHFREQLAKGSQLAESLASKFSTDDYASKKSQAGRAPLTLSILREMHKKSKVREVLETKQDAGSHVCSSSHAQSAARCSRSSTCPRFCEQKAHPAVDAVNVSHAVPADSAALPSSHSGARSAQTFCPPCGTTQLTRTPEHGSSGLWEEMRPQKMNASGDLAAFSSLYRPNSKSSGADLLEKNLVEIQNLRQRLEESVCVNDRLRERLEHVLSSADQGKSTAQSAPDVSVKDPRSHTQSHSSGSGQDIL
ncbi:myomegalin-like [Lemur catta]|uniref:myomegalin-like n=1 Tax=Lemur catta TaxID=9447 RepID=UPI001E26E0C8|nr:myomegalin-like [Lemur catta]XP_045400854.1 myomegalin-like [Lemur catta]